MDKKQNNSRHNNDTMIGKLIFDRYKLIKKLGAGSFGSIYSAKYENQYFAVKFEEKTLNQNLLENEAYLMSYLHGPGLPFIKSYGFSSKYYILIMELMGKSLEDIFESFVVKKMSTRCVCNIGYQILEILEYIHNKHVIHRDIKPDNFVIGRKNKKKYIYILDFGLSKKYRSSKTLKHYQILKHKNLTGTARYASINALNGLTQSRRDDLEGMGYVLMYFLLGKLPWQGIHAKNEEERYRKIMEKKINTLPEELCKGFPYQFTEYIKYTRNLEYEQDPDYDYLRNLFVNVLNSDGFIIDCYYDWDKETINYFRDFKNIETKANNNKSKNDSTSINTSKQLNIKDIYSYTSTENKIFNNSKFNSNNNIIHNNSKLQSNSNINNISLINNQGNALNAICGSNNNIEFSELKQKENDYLNGNEIINDYIKDKNENIDIGYNDKNNLVNKGNNESKNNVIIEQNKLNNLNNYIENNKEENNKMERNFERNNFKRVKHNRCCIIY